MLNIIKHIPKELIDCDISDLNHILKGPTLIHIEGIEKEPLLISTLLHGNETTSFFVLQKLLKDFEDKKPQRDIIFFVGNTMAASQGLRQLPGQIDYNRIWKKGDAPEYKMAQEIYNYVSEFRPFANIDLHNNTGNNPYYACVNKIDSKFLKLASLFSKKIVYFTEPSEVESMMFSKLCPSVTIEAGIAGREEATIEVYNYIHKVLELKDFIITSENKGLNVYHTIARIVVDQKMKVDFNNSLDNAEISFLKDIDDLNFSMVMPGQSIGKVINESAIKVVDNNKKDITPIFLKIEDNNIIAEQSFIPSMFTKNVEVMKSDCLGYVMEKILSV